MHKDQQLVETLLASEWLRLMTNHVVVDGCSVVMRGFSFFPGRESNVEVSTKGLLSC